MQEAIRNCPICDSTKTTLFLVKGSEVLVRCINCSMVFTSRIASSIESGAFYNDLGNEYYLSPEKLEGDYAAVRFKRELNIFREHVRNGKVLDVGCSTGGFLYNLKSRFPEDYSVQGTDISGPGLDYAAKKGIPVIRSDFVSEETESDYDAITFWAVLEHVPYPKKFVLKAFETLKPDGICIVLVPNLNSLAVRLLGANYRYILPQHVNYFTNHTLRRLCSPPFEAVTEISTHFNPVVIVQDWLGNAGSTDVERAKLLRKTNRAKSNPLLFPFRLLYSVTEKALGSLGLGDNLVLVLRKGKA
jgi:2-polyprenyl-3-methyl-5-hydroxy-6-metoxy-1,4-benzoquinol methylase